MRRGVRRLLSGVVVALGVGCADPAQDAASGPPSAASSAPVAATTPGPAHLPPATLTGGALSRAPSGDALYVAHEDMSVVRGLALPSLTPAPPLELPGPPAAVLALADAVLVTVRDPGLLVIARPGAGGALTIDKQIPLPADAWGLAVTPDEKLALVTSAWTHQVSAVDLAKGEKLWTVDVAREPRGVVVRADGKAAYVTHLTRAALTRIDGLDGASPSVKDVTLPAAPLRTLGKDSEVATLGYAAVLSPDGARLFVPRQTLAAKGLEVWNGYATVDTLLTSDESALAVRSPKVSIQWSDDFMDAFGKSEISGMLQLKDPTITGPFPTQKRSAFIQPRAAAYRAKTGTLLVASEGEDLLVELDALAIDPSLAPLRRYDLGAWDEKTMKTRCGAPGGIALSADERTAWVFCRSTMSLATVTLDPLEQVGGEPTPAPIEVSSLATDPLKADEALGRTLFYNGRDGVLSGGFGCAGCHPEGRDDGHVWHMEEEQKDGKTELTMMHAVEIGDVYQTLLGVPRQTPMLAGRIRAAGPYGWKGESPSLRHRALVGFGIHRWFSWSGDAPARIARVDPLVAFLRVGLRPPPVDPAPLSKEEQAGKRLFEDPSVGCATCHAPSSEFTDRASYDLGELPLAKGRFSKEIDWKFKTPSLLFIGGTAPYLHDGSIPTLELLIDLNGDRMGHTKQLNKEQRAALVAYLKRL